MLKDDKRICRKDNGWITKFAARCHLLNSEPEHKLFELRKKHTQYIIISVQLLNWLNKIWGADVKMHLSYSMKFRFLFLKFHLRLHSENLGPVYTGSNPNGIGSIWIRSTFCAAFTRVRIQNCSRLHGIGSIWISWILSSALVNLFSYLNQIH